MKDIDKIKITFVTVFSVVNGWLGSLAIPFYFLLLTNLLDYVTGVVAAACRGERVNSERGFQGIAKKVCMWLLVVVGYIVDYLIIAMGHTLHIELGFQCLFAVAVIFWLLANELISILENIHDIGVPMPPFLMKAVKFIKEKTEETADVVPSENKEEV